MKKNVYLLLIFLGLYICVSAQTMTVSASYYEYHKDWHDYCLQAKNVTMKPEELELWLTNGEWEEKLIQKSGFSARRFYPEDFDRTWERYEGGYFVKSDTALDALLPDGGRTIVTVYLNEHETKINFISFTLTVAKKSPESTEAISGKGTGKHAYGKAGENVGTLHGDSTKWPAVWNSRGTQMILFTVSGSVFCGFAGSIYWDIRVLKRYKKKILEKGGVWRWLN